nr:thioredoxin H9-like [Ipomoea batatas]
MTMGSYISRLCMPKFLFKNHGDGDGDADEDESWHNVEFSSENVHLIATGEEWEEKMEEAKKDDKIVIVNFSASWCVPCRAIAPLYSELSEKHLSWMFLVVDVDVLSVSTQKLNKISKSNTRNRICILHFVVLFS